MRTWEDWSDKQISAAIIKIKGYRVSDKSHVSEEAWNHPTKCCYGTFPQENRKKYGNSFIGWFGSKDYCNNWEDIGPVICDNEISLIPPVSNGTNGWMAERFYPSNCGKIIYYIDKNPHRAAAIVFLMMNGIKPD